MTAIAVGGLIAATHAQTSREPQTLFSSVRTDVTIVIYKHPTGADMVEITMRDPKYPIDKLRSQVEEMCKSWAAPPRGLYVGKVAISTDPSPTFTFVKASFATNGIIDEKQGLLRIEPIARAFAGVPAPFTIEGITVNFENLVPNPTTLQSFGEPGIIRVQGRYSDTPPLRGLEYRIHLLSQDPSRIAIPDHFVPKKPVEKPRSLRSEGGKLSLVTAIIVAGLAAGALVYFALLRTGNRTRA